MNFRKNRHADEPEINLIPFIDILLVIIIFLVITTTYSRFTELKVSLPVADANAPEQKLQQIHVAVTADGRYAINNRLLPYANPMGLAGDLIAAANNASDVTIVINADAGAAHQSVVNVLEAARIAGLARITFAAQATPK